MYYLSNEDLACISYQKFNMDYEKLFYSYRGMPHIAHTDGLDNAAKERGRWQPKKTAAGHTCYDGTDRYI